MIRINKDSEWYSIAADLLASLFGAGAVALTHGFCNGMINNSNAGGFTKFGMKAGRLGLETITMYEVSTAMRKEIDELVDAFNDISGVVETYKENKSLEASKELSKDE